VSARIRFFLASANRDGRAPDTNAIAPGNLPDVDRLDDAPNEAKQLDAV
jgi:hypothetical protein